MVAAISSIHESNEHGQALLEHVVQLFTDLLVASGATNPMIRVAMQKSVERDAIESGSTKFTVLGSLLRDCMEVMCAWRRDIEFTDADGAPLALQLASNSACFENLCKRAKCRQPASEILRALVEFGAVTIDADERIRSKTPTFLLGHASMGGTLATDALLKHLEGFLRCVHRNLRSVSGDGTPRFERACTVTVAAELEPIFDQLVRRRGQEFIDSIDEWLERNAKLDSPRGHYVELGAGAYFVNFGQRLGRNRLLQDKKI
jgi:hypothetical protein